MYCIVCFFLLTMIQKKTFTRSNQRPFTKFLRLICSSKHTTSGTTAIIRVTVFLEFTVIHLFSRICWFGFLFVCFQGQDWYIIERYDDNYHSCIFKSFKVMLIFYFSTMECCVLFTVLAKNMGEAVSEISIWPY